MGSDEFWAIEDPYYETRKCAPNRKCRYLWSESESQAKRDVATDNDGQNSE